MCLFGLETELIQIFLETDEVSDLSDEKSNYTPIIFLLKKNKGNANFRYQGS